MRCALYCRVSKGEDQTTDNQRLALKEYAQAHGWEVVRVYEDEASANDLRGRKEWRQFLDDVRKGGIDVLLVTKLDRAFRSVMECYNCLARLDAHKVGFISTTQVIDTVTPTGKLMLGVLAAVAEFELTLIKDRTRAGLARARSEGKHLGRPAGSKDKKQRKKAGYFQRWAV